MGVRDLLEVMRAEVLARLKEERKRRREYLKVRTYILNTKGKDRGVERGRKVL